MVMRLFSALMPHEGQFFEFFNQHARCIGEGGKAMADLLADYANEKARGERINRIHEIEGQADRITHDTMALLHRTFVTPFDRNDIHRLSSRLDDILDLVQDCAETLTLYDVREVTPEATHLGNLIRISCERVQSAVQLLPSMKNAQSILAFCRELDQLESDADKVLRAAVSKLFREEPDVRKVIKLKAIYELLESATDKCRDVADVIEGVVLENA
jgi:predicted phosphate transport protein (TIGR00153 family)